MAAAGRPCPCPVAKLQDTAAGLGLGPLGHTASGEHRGAGSDGVHQRLRHQVFRTVCWMQRATSACSASACRSGKINQANGEGEAILTVAKATAEGIELVGTAINKQGGTDAVSLRIAEQYVEAFKELAKKSNTLMLPTDAGNPGSMVAQALSVFDSIRTKEEK